MQVKARPLQSGQYGAVPTSFWLMQTADSKQQTAECRTIVNSQVGKGPGELAISQRSWHCIPDRCAAGRLLCRSGCLLFAERCLLFAVFFRL
jgi:hypothetical protein